MSEFLLLCLPLVLYVPLLVCFIVEFLTLYIVFSVKSVSQGIKLFFVILLGNIISAVLLFPLVFIWFGVLPTMFFGITTSIKSGVVHKPVFLLSFYFVLIGVFTLIKLSVIALTLKKELNQFFGWLLTINIIIVAMGMYVLSIQFGIDVFFDRLRMVALSGTGEFFNVPIEDWSFAYFIALVIKFFIVAIEISKIMSVRTTLVVFLNTFFTGIVSPFVLVGRPVPFGFAVVYFLFIVPFLEAAVGWILLRENLLNSRYNTVKKFMRLMVVATIAGRIGGMITVYPILLLYQFFLQILS